MPKPYFRQVPDFEYVDRTPGDQTISNYRRVKNLFKRARLREDIFEDLSFFTKYKIVGNERPDNIAEKLYEDSTLDWIILLANNITNIYTEWPMSENSFYNFLIDKYGTEEKLNEVHHYESEGIKNSKGIWIVRKGLTVPENFSVTYLDPNAAVGITTISGYTEAITNYEYENKIQEAKRDIFVLKQEFLNVVFNDLEDIMEYKKGSTQYVNETLKKAENIRLYQ